MTVSTRALIMRLPISRSLAQKGTSPQRSTRRLRSSSGRCTTAYTDLVGATLKSGSRGSATVSATRARSISNSSARSSGLRLEA